MRDVPLKWQHEMTTAASSTIPGSELTLVAGTTSPQDLIYRVTPNTEEGCEGEDFTVTITVNPEPQIDNFVETICEGDTFTSITPEDSTHE